MGLVCKLRGHSWNGCVCARCGERRDEGHSYQLDAKRSASCGAKRDEEHLWQGCICSVCGKVRSEGHEWSDAEPNGKADHRRTCKICRNMELEPHSFEWVAGQTCRRRCTECGYTMVWHEFRNGTCMTCGIDESDYYCKRILAGEVEYESWDDSGGAGDRRTCGDHVKSASALSEIALSDKKGITTNARLECIQKLADIAKQGGQEADIANKALFKLALKPELGWTTLTCAKAITDPELASDRRIVEVIREVEQACDEYDNAMIASDSGLYTTG